MAWQKTLISINLSEEELQFLTAKLFKQLGAVVRETGSDIIRQAILRDYKFLKDTDAGRWSTKIDSADKFRVKYELVCDVGDIIKTLAVRKKRRENSKPRFRLLDLE